MSRRLTTLGVALVMTGALWIILYSSMAAQIERGGPAPTRTSDVPSPTPAPGATPTIDRLAAPPTAAAPNQADEGAQLYWLHCQPCHGDQGQGLTDEWRAQYPPEDQNCWESGCHGPRPYDQSFVLPTSVPALIGPAVDRIMGTEGTQVLQKFETMGDVYRYASVTMPLFFPGELQEEEYLAIMAHLARENGLWDGTPLTTTNLDNHPLRPPTTPAATSSGGHLVQATATSEAHTPAAFPLSGNRWIPVGLGALVTLLVVGGLLLWRNRVR
jgi:mono/diheme cytochrome c family protein